MERRENGEQAAGHHERGENQRPVERVGGRFRHLHAERDKKQRHKKVAQARDLCRDIERVRKSGDGDSGHQRAHLAGQAELASQTREQKAPGQRAYQHELRQLSDDAEQRRQQEAAHAERHRDQAEHFHKRPRYESRRRR